MFSFTLACLPDRALAPARIVGAMMRAWPGDAPDGIAGAELGRAAAAVARWAVMDADLHVAPVADAAAGTLVAGDVRLHNAAELAAALGLSGRGPSDLALAGLAVARWGERACDRLVGEFAFAVWDERAGTLFAARDHVGMRPLYYHASDAGIFLGSDVRQLLPVVPPAARALCDEKIADHFSSRYRLFGRSFFEGILLLKPGHCLLARGAAARETPYWAMPPEPRLQDAPPYEESCARLRELFTRAVVDRLRSDRPIVAHSSGGFDSSLILVAADAAYRREPHRPPLVMASALTPGMPCDDSRTMDALAEHVGFEGVRWSALDAELIELDAPIAAYPGIRRGPGGGPRGDLEAARVRGARVLIGGFAGDDIGYSWEIFRDLARAGRWGSLARQVSSVFTPARGARVALGAMTGLLPPAWIERLRGWKRRARDRPPPWLGPRLRELWPPAEVEGVPARAGTRSHLRWALWRQLTSAHFSMLVDMMALYAANEGIELRLPFTDVRLLEHVLSIPWQQRLPNGEMRRLRRDALDPMLPPAFIGRTGQGSWDPVATHNVRHMLPRLAALLDGPRWESAPYVDQARARALLRQVLDAPAGAAAPRLWYEVADIGIFEAWLRHILS